jgi:hypothetical protein
MALQKLRDFYQSSNTEVFNDLMKNKVVVSEKIAAPSLYVRRGLNGFEFFKNGTSEELSIVDRTLVSLYETAITELDSEKYAVVVNLSSYGRLDKEVYLLEKEKPKVTKKSKSGLVSLYSRPKILDAVCCNGIKVGKVGSKSLL